MEIKLKSGAKLVITESAFDDAIALNDAVINALGDIEITKEIAETEFDVENPLLSLTKATGILNLVTNKIKTLASDVVVRMCIFKCAERSTYDNVRVTRDLFDDPKIGAAARKDFYAICAQIIEVNCRPFLESLLSLLKVRSQTNAGTQASK